MLNKKAKRVKGSVLYTVIAVMMIMTVLVAAALTLASSANKRAYNTYADNQALYTARSVVDSMLQVLEENGPDAVGEVDLDVLNASLDPSMGKVTYAAIEDYGKFSDYNFDIKLKNAADAPLYKLTATIELAGHENTVSLYCTDGEEEKPFLFTNALTSMGKLDIDPQGIPQQFGNIYAGIAEPNDMLTQLSMIINGAYGMQGSLNNQHGIKLTIDDFNKGVYIGGNLTFVSDSGAERIFAMSKDIKDIEYRQLPYLYVKDKFEALKAGGADINIGDAAHPYIVMTDTLNMIEMGIGYDAGTVARVYGDIYIYSDTEASYLLARTGNQCVNSWDSDQAQVNLNKKVEFCPSGNKYTGGNLYSLGDVIVKTDTTGSTVANNIYARSLKFTGNNSTLGYNTTGAVVAEKVDLFQGVGNEWNVCAGDYNFPNGLFTDPDNFSAVKKQHINGVRYDPENLWLKSGKSDMHNNTSRTIEAVKNKMCHLNSRSEFASIDFSDALNNIDPTLIDSDNKEYKDIKKEVVFNEGSFVEIELEKPQNLINDEVTISLGLSNTWKEHKFLSDEDIANGVESKINIPLNNQTLTPTDDGKVKLNIEIKPKYDESNCYEWSRPEYYKIWAADYITSNKTNIENTVIINWFNTYHPENANQAIINMKQQLYRDYCIKYHYPVPPSNVTIDDYWINWYWNMSGDLTEDQKTDAINNALLAEGRRLWEDPDNTYISQEDKDKLIKDEENTACQNEWQRLCENQPKEIKIKSITVNYNAQIKRSYNELTRNAQSFLEWIKLANDTAFNNNGGVIYIDDIDKSVKLEKDTSTNPPTMKISVAKTGGEFEEKGSFDYDTKYDDFLRAVVENVTFPESMAKDKVIDTNGGFVDTSFFSSPYVKQIYDYSTYMDEKFEEKLKDIKTYEIYFEAGIQKIREIDKDGNVIGYVEFNESNPIKESCILKGVINNEKTLYIDPGNEEIYIKLDGNFTLDHSANIIVNDSGKGKVNFYIPDSLKLETRAKILTQTYYEQSKNGEFEIYSGVKAPDGDTTKYVPNIYFFVGKSMTLSSAAVISGYIFGPEAEFTNGSSGESYKITYNGINEYESKVAILGSGIFKSARLEQVGYIYIDESGADKDDDAKEIPPFVKLYYQAY